MQTSFLWAVLSAAVFLRANVGGVRPDFYETGEAIKLRDDLDRSSLANGQDNAPLFAVKTSKMAAALAAGMTAMSEGITEFIKEGKNTVTESQDASATAEAEDESAGSGNNNPGYIKDGLEKVVGGLWQMDVLLVPSRYHTSTALAKLQTDHAEVFLNMPDITLDIDRFRNFGDTAGLAKALMTILNQAITAAPAPKLPAYLEALSKIVGGIGKGWQEHGSASMDMAIQANWQGLVAGLEAVNDNETDLSYEISKLDVSLGQLNTKVLAEKRRIVSSKVCYKRNRSPPKRRPNVCEAGWEYDQVSSCIPAPSSTVDCLDFCGNEAGMCSSYCGDGKACCKEDDGDAIACQGAGGFDDNADIHQCVEPGIKVAFLVEEAGEAMLRGYWFEEAVAVNKRPAYRHRTHIGGVPARMSWSEKTKEWQMFTEHPPPSTEKEILYTSGMDSPTFPVHSWQPRDGTGKVTIVKKATPGFNMSDTDLRQPPSVKVATCEGQYEPHGLWCIADCAGKWTKKVETCEQLCVGDHPIDGEEGICGTDSTYMQFATLSMEGMAANSRLFTRESLTSSLQESNVDVFALSATVDSFFDQSEHFQHPLCVDPDAPTV